MVTHCSIPPIVMNFSSLIALVCANRLTELRKTGIRKIDLIIALIGS
jgi:hypothetical protein